MNNSLSINHLKYQSIVYMLNSYSPWHFCGKEQRVRWKVKGHVLIIIKIVGFYLKTVTFKLLEICVLPRLIDAQCCKTTDISVLALIETEAKLKIK